MKKKIIIGSLLIFSLFLHSQEKIGLALSGGGARGLAQIGVLKVIDELGIQVDFIAGTSTGAFIGGLYAMGYSGNEIEDIFLKMDWKEILNDKISRKDIYISQKRWLPYANLSFDLDENYLPKIPQAFFVGNNLINFLFDLTYPVSVVKNFDELQIPFRCNATNILTGELKVFSDGPLHEAIRASISFPSILKPFELDDGLYVDGGLLANLPAEIVADMGADFVIGVQTNSGLKEKEEIESLIDVLDQTVNLSITSNINKSTEFCDLIIKPELDNISVLDFSKKKEIILAGEIAARKYLKGIENSDKSKIKKTALLPSEIEFSKIRILGNKHLSKSKVKEFTGLKTDTFYAKSDIILAIKNAYDSQLFSLIYPVIEKKDEKYILKIKVKESNRKQLGIHFGYINNKDIILGATFSFDNMIQRNSKLLFNFQVGDKKELNLDYVKNFGKQWGIYFRIFPYLREQKIYSYNEEHKKTGSVKSLETGGTLGIGIYAKKAVILEGYGFTFNTKLYQDIADFEDRYYHSTGVGLKLYHENLDDFVFPMKGLQFLMKFNTARKIFFSDSGYKKLYSKVRILMPFKDKISLKYQFEYGTYFKKYDLDFDPFYIGGIDSFLGCNTGERSAPIYKIYSLSIRYKILNNLFADLHYNLLNLGTEDVWLPEKNLYPALGLKLGFKSFIGPVRVAAAIDEEYRTYYYLSIGYEFDQFEFSRR